MVAVARLLRQARAALSPVASLALTGCAARTAHSAQTYVSRGARGESFAQCPVPGMIREMSESRDRVARQALEMFAEQSYDAVSMRDLGQALNMQAPSIYSHFPSKESLLLSTLAPLLDGLDEVFADIPSAPVSDDRRREWLSGWLGVLIEHRLASRVAMYDRAVMGNPVLQPRMWNMHVRLLEALSAFGVTEHVLANAVIGGVSSPIHAAHLGVDVGELTVNRAVDLAERLIVAARTP